MIVDCKTTCIIYLTNKSRMIDSYRKTELLKELYQLIMLTVALVGALAVNALAISVNVHYDKSSLKTSFKSGASDVVASYSNTTEGWFYLDINAGAASTPDEKVEALKMVFMFGQF